MSFQQSSKNLTTTGTHDLKTIDTPEQITMGILN